MSYWRMKIKYIITLLLFLFFVLSVSAQKSTCIIVSKEEMQMSVYNGEGTEMLKFPIACGKNYGQKLRAGDKRTPEGIFKVVGKEASSAWTHDFGNGPIRGAYGPLFIRLNTPGFKGIGIHGTHDERTVPGRETLGCIRMKNRDLLELAKVIDEKTLVIILPSRDDVLAALSQKQIGNGKLFIY